MRGENCALPEKIFTDFPFDFDLRNPRPIIARRRHLRNCGGGERCRTERRENHPILSDGYGSFFPIEPRICQTNTHNAEILADSDRRKAAEKVCFENAAEPRITDACAFEPQAEPCLPNARARIARAGRRGKKRNIRIIRAAAVCKSVKENRAVGREPRRTDVNAGLLLLRSRSFCFGFCFGFCFRHFCFCVFGCRFGFPRLIYQRFQRVNLCLHRLNLTFELPDTNLSFVACRGFAGLCFRVGLILSICRKAESQN